MASGFEDLLPSIDGWGAEHAAAAIVGPGGIVATHGDPAHVFRWASITKPITAWAALIAAEAGQLDLDEAAGPPGSTVRHVLAHTSGLPFDGEVALGAPGRRRIYSNTGFDVVGALIGERAEEPFEDALARTVLEPLGMGSTTLLERPSQGLHGSLADMCAFVGELLRPALVTTETAAEATTVAFPGVVGVVPGVGNFDPCDWGLGVEIHGTKSPHWMGDSLSRAAFGHFGGAGTFIWVDPTLDRALVVLTDREFGPWALDVWPAFSDWVVEAVKRRTP